MTTGFRTGRKKEFNWGWGEGGERGGSANNCCGMVTIASMYNRTSCHKKLRGSPVISFALVLMAHDAGCCAETYLPSSCKLQLTSMHAACPSCRLVTILARPFKLSNCYEPQQSSISSGRYHNFAPYILIIISKNNRRLWT